MAEAAGATAIVAVIAGIVERVGERLAGGAAAAVATATAAAAAAAAAACRRVQLDIVEIKVAIELVEIERLHTSVSVAEPNRRAHAPHLRISVDLLAH